MDHAPQTVYHTCEANKYSDFLSVLQITLVIAELQTLNRHEVADHTILCRHVIRNHKMHIDIDNAWKQKTVFLSFY